MNIRQLWDTVVLRDVLGYMFPGAVTLLALSLVLTGCIWTDPAQAARVVSRVHAWLAQDGFPWLAAAVGLPLSYIAGYLQSWIMDFLEPKCSLSNLGMIAMEYLADVDNPMKERYFSTALELLAEHSEDNFEELRRHLQEGERKDDEKAGRQAYHLWRLCDYYIMHTSADMHSTYPGRYYVLTLLFANLGMSTFFVVLGILIGKGMVQALLYDAGPCALTRIVVLLVILGTILLGRSVEYRKQFVQRAFPILYTVTRTSPKGLA
jgi:hypothetical protein